MINEFGFYELVVIETALFLLLIAIIIVSIGTYWRRFFDAIKLSDEQYFELRKIQTNKKDELFDYFKIKYTSKNDKNKKKKKKL